MGVPDRVEDILDHFRVLQAFGPSQLTAGSFGFRQRLWGYLDWNGLNLRSQGPGNQSLNVLRVLLLDLTEFRQLRLSILLQRGLAPPLVFEGLSSDYLLYSHIDRRSPIDMCVNGSFLSICANRVHIVPRRRPRVLG